MSQIGKYFKAKEFECPCCKLTAPSRRLVGILDAARAQLGPLRINSGYRCPKHNDEVGGKKNRLHLPIGGTVYAADVTYSDVGKRHGEHILKLYITLEGIARRPTWLPNVPRPLRILPSPLQASRSLPI